MTKRCSKNDAFRFNNVGKLSSPACGTPDVITELLLRLPKTFSSENLRRELAFFYKARRHAMLQSSLSIGLGEIFGTQGTLEL